MHQETEKHVGKEFMYPCNVLSKSEYFKCEWSRSSDTGPTGVTWNTPGKMRHHGHLLQTVAMKFDFAVGEKKQLDAPHSVNKWPELQGP